MRRYLVAALVAAAVLSLASCSGARSYIAVVQGNSAYQRGRYRQATVDYLRAQTSGAYPDRVAYDLGNVYHALGEPEGASSEWAKAEKTRNRQVLAATLFNEGILDYELGRYREAYERFKKVLEITPGDIDAKVNLELSYAKMTTREVPPQAGASSEPVVVKHQNNQANQILNIVRQKERGYFVSPPPGPSNPNIANW